MEQVLALSPQISRTSLWIGRVLGGLVVTFLLVDSIGKLIPLAPYVEGTRQLGYAIEIVRPLGALLLVSTVLHVVPRTQVLGALLLTAYFGGATATVVRAATPFWFSVTMGIVLWIAVGLRNPRVRALVMTPSAS